MSIVVGLAKQMRYSSAGECQSACKLRADRLGLVEHCERIIATRWSFRPCTDVFWFRRRSAIVAAIGDCRRLLRTGRVAG